VARSVPGEHGSRIPGGREDLGESARGPRRAMSLSSRGWIACVLLAWGPAYAQSDGLTITLTGQSMIRSDIRATAPDAVPKIRSLLHGDVVFTNFEGAIAAAGQSVTGGGRGFLA